MNLLYALYDGETGVCADVIQHCKIHSASFNTLQTIEYTVLLYNLAK